MRKLAPFLFFAILTAIAAWPVVSQPGSVLIGSDTDTFINPWADMWTLKALQDPERSLWFTDYLFYPQGTDLHFHSFSHLTTAASLALRPLLGVLPAYNVATLLHIVLAGVAMYHLARYLTASQVAALLAGMVFAFNSYNLWQSSHPVLVGIWPLPWAALFLLQGLERHDSRRALLAALFVLLAALVSTLMLILTSLWLGFVLFCALVRGHLTRDSLRVLSLFAVAAGALALLPLLPLLREAIVTGNLGTVPGGVNLPAGVLSPFRSLWSDPQTRDLHFGVVPLVLLLAGLFDLRNAWPWYLFLIVSYLFAIGPQPMVGGTWLEITLPWSTLVQPVLRHTHRLNLLMSGALAVLVAIGWRALSERIGDKSWQARLLALIAGGLIFAEYTHPPFPRLVPQVSAFYTEFLDDVPNDVALAILPAGRQQDKFYMYYQTLHGHKMTGGVVSRPDPDTFNFLRGNPLLRAGSLYWEPSSLPGDVSPALQQLSAAGVGFLVLDKYLFARSSHLELELWQNRIPLAPIYEDELVVVFPTRVK